MAKLKRIKAEGSSSPKKRKRVEFHEGTSSGSKMETVEVTFPSSTEIAESSQEIQGNNSELLPEAIVQKTIQSRYSLSKIVELNGRLTDEQKVAVHSIGFGGLLSLKCTMLKHPLCKWLMDSFDPVSRKLNIHGHEVLVTSKHVQEVLGLPNGGSDVPHGGINEDIGELCREFDVYDSLIPLVKLSEKLRKCHSHGDEFKRMYCIYIMGYFLCPTPDHVVQKKMLHVVKDTNAISSYNWSKFVLESLTHSIECATKLQLARVSGCFFFLMILFFEHFKPSQNVLHSHNIHPCIGFWTNKEVNKRMKKYAANGGFECENAVVAVPDRFKEQDEVISNVIFSSESADCRLSAIETKIDEVKKELCEIKSMMIEVKVEIAQLTTAVNLIVEKLDRKEHRKFEDKVKDATQTDMDDDKKGNGESSRNKNVGDETNGNDNGGSIENLIA